MASPPLLVGAAFGLSGAIFQRLARNPLASPDIIGINAGAAAAAVFVIVIVHGTRAQVTLGALAGSTAHRPRASTSSPTSGASPATGSCSSASA